MGKFADIFKQSVSLGLLPARQAEQAEKSLRDASMSSEPVSSPGGNITVIRAAGGSGTARLFKKQNVRSLRNYAEYSVWVRAAIDIYRNSIGQAQWQVVPYDPMKPPNESVQREIEDLLDNPNTTGESYSSIKERMVEDYLVLGHGAVEQALRRDGTPYQLWPVDASRFAFADEWDGTDPQLPRYAELYPNGTVKRWLSDAHAMVLVNRPRSYDCLGLSHVEVLDLAVRALLEGDDFLLNRTLSSTPDGLLNLGEGFDQRQADQFRQELQRIKHAFAVMGGSKNPSFIPFRASEREMRLLDTQIWFVRQVCSIFQIPTAVLALAVDTSRANTEAMLQNADNGPGALLWRIREMERAKIVRKFGRYEEINIDLDYPIMSKRDEKQQAEITSIQTGNGAWVSINEARRAAGLPPLDDVEAADEILIPTRQGPIPLSKLNEQFYGDGADETELDKGKEPSETS